MVRSLQVLNHLLLVFGLGYCVITGEWYWLLYSLITYWIIGVLGINIGYHRLISHRSFETNVWIERLLAVIGIITTIGSPLAWTALHRQHHMCADADGDPHSPKRLGKIKAWFGLWKVEILKPSLIKDLRKDRFYRETHRWYFPIVIAYATILFVIDPLLVVFIYAIPAVFVLHSTSTIIVVAHIHGYKTHKVEDESRNSWIASLITLGEGWHNNHHANSRNWKQGEKWWEIDPPSWIIRIIKK